MMGDDAYRMFHPHCSSRSWLLLVFFFRGAMLMAGMIHIGCPTHKNTTMLVCVECCSVLVLMKSSFSMDTDTLC